MKILIMSFPRSGTSLTYRFFIQHKDIKKAFFEPLRYPEKFLEVYLDLKKGVNCVEKNIYEKPYIDETKKISYIDYCNLWNERFGNEAKIIQIVRHPYDQWNSLIHYKYQKENMNYKQPLYKGSKREDHKIVENLRRYFSCVSDYTKKIMSYPNSLSIKYEELIDNPEMTIEKLYKFCELDPERVKSRETIMIRERFLYKENGHRIDNEPSLKKYSKEYWEVMNVNIQSVLDVFNLIDGPIYEV